MISGLAITVSFTSFLGLFVLAGWLVAHRTKHDEATYVTGGRQFGRFVTGLSAGAASTSGFIMIGAVGAGYTMGISAFVLPFGWLIGELFFWFLLPDKINRAVRQYDSYTVPDLISATVKEEKIITVRAIAGIATICFVSVFAAAQLLAAGKTVGTIFDVNLIVGIAISGGVIILYCFRGGLSASMWINFCQAIIMFVTIMALLILAINHEGGMVNIFSRLHEVDPKLLQLNGWYTLIGGIAALIGYVFASIGTDLSSPIFLVRLAACKSPEEASNSKWIYIGFTQLTWWSMTFFGMIIRLTFPELTDPELGLPTFANALLPPWLIGIVMAGVFASIASTLDGQILVISNAFTVDIAPTWHEKMFAKFGMSIQYGATILVGVALILISSTLTSSVYSIIQFASTAIAGSFAPAMLIVVLGWQTRSLVLVFTMVVGAGIAVVWELMGNNAFMLGTLPAIVIALCVHRLLMMLTDKYSGGWRKISQVSEE